MNCVFCKIIEGEIPSYTIYEDDIVKCFLDINPVNTGHLLIIPKEHTLDITTIKDETLVHIKKIALELKELVEKKLKCDGVQFVQNNGIAQEVKHYHLHLIPKYENEIKMDPKEVFEILTK